MLSRLNSEHIRACSKLLKIRNSLLSPIWSFPSFVSESCHTNTDNYFFFNFGHIRKASYSGWGKLRTAIKNVKFSNQVDVRYFSFFFWLVLPWFYCFFNSETYRKQTFVHRLRCGMSARLTPDQNVACSSHVGASWWFVVHLTSLCLIAQKLSAKKAASATALNLLLNAISSQFGTHFCVCKSSQYQ